MTEVLVRLPADPAAAAVPSASTKSFDPTARNAALRELTTLLAERNMRSTTVFAQLKAEFGIPLGERLSETENAINQLDFSRAGMPSPRCKSTCSASLSETGSWLACVHGPARG